MADLHSMYEAPAADIGPTSPRSELQAATQVLRRHGGYMEGELSLWLATTADIHGPDKTGRRCDRDGDLWPCFDIQAAQKVAFAIGYRSPASERGEAMTTRAKTAEPEEPDDAAPCSATFREEPMPDTAYCGERGYHQRHTAWQGSNYYAWLDGDEGAGWD